MATFERDGLVSTKDSDGNLNIIYPITRKSAISDLEEATSSDEGLMSAADKTKLDGIAEGANNYSLPNATNTQLGGVTVGENITNVDGHISINKDNVTKALGYTPPTQDTTYSEATSESSGLMSAYDKQKLDDFGCVVGKDDIGYFIQTNEYTIKSDSNGTYIETEE